MNIEETLKEIADRTRRMESRMVQLGDHVGANLRSKQRIEITHSEKTGNTWVSIDSLDVSISRIVTEMQQHGVDLDQVDVFLGPKAVATVYLKR